MPINRFRVGAYLTGGIVVSYAQSLVHFQHFEHKFIYSDTNIQSFEEDAIF